MSAKVSVKCTYCDTEFLKYAKKIRPKNFCCNKHRDMYNATKNRGENHHQYKPKTEYTCLYCNTVFKRTASAKRNRKHDFCCSGHWYAWRSENKESEFRYMRKGIVVNCANCDASIIRIPARIKNNEKQFCNDKCKGQWMSNHAVGDKALRWAGGNLTVPCAQCGSELERPMNAIKRSEKHFCDKDCYSAWMSENKTGESHPLWTGGYKNYYGPNWNKQRQAARERDNHTCQKCGKTREENGKELDVHHIIPFRKFKYKAGENDNYLQANQLDNLTTLCTNCHSKTKAVKPKS